MPSGSAPTPGATHRAPSREILDFRRITRASGSGMHYAIARGQHSNLEHERARRSQATEEFGHEHAGLRAEPYVLRLSYRPDVNADSPAPPAAADLLRVERPCDPGHEENEAPRVRSCLHCQKRRDLRIPFPAETAGRDDRPAPAHARDPRAQQALVLGWGRPMVRRRA